jgi:hypothetical protein
VKEGVVTCIVTAIVAIALAAISMTVIVQTQMTERTKFQNGYEQQVERHEDVTLPMWRKK